MFLSIFKLKCLKKFHLFFNESKTFSITTIFLFMLQSNANTINKAKGTKEEVIFQGFHVTYVIKCKLVYITKIYIFHT